MANGPGGATNSMWPSGGAFTTRSTPMLPFAPGRLSTTNGPPKVLLKSSASARDRKSTEPPGGLVAMMRTVRLGQDGWARAASGSADATTSVKTLSAHFIERDYRTPRASISSRKGSGRKPRSRADHRASRRCHSTPSPMIARPTSESARSEEHTSELQSLAYLVCRLLLEKKKNPQCQFR